MNVGAVVDDGLSDNESDNEDADENDSTILPEMNANGDERLDSGTGRAISDSVKCIALDLRYSMHTEVFLCSSIFDAYDVPGTEEEDDATIVDLQETAHLAPSALLGRAVVKTQNLQNIIQDLWEATNFYPHDWDNRCRSFVDGVGKRPKSHSVLNLLKLAQSSIADTVSSDDEEDFANEAEYRSLHSMTSARLAVEADNLGSQVLLVTEDRNKVYAMKVERVWNELKTLLGRINCLLGHVVDSSRGDLKRAQFTRQLGSFHESLERTPLEIDSIVCNRMISGLVQLLLVVKQYLHHCGILSHPMVSAASNDSNVRQERWGSRP